MKMKKILSVMLVLCMLFTGCFMLFSCGNPDAGKDPEKKLTVEDLENNPNLIAVGASKALTAFFDVAGISNVVEGMNKGAVSVVVDNAMLKDEIGLGKTEVTVYTDMQNELLNKIAMKLNANYEDETYGGIFYIDKNGMGVSGESIFGTDDTYKVDILNLMDNFKNSALMDMMGGEAAAEIVAPSFELLSTTWKMLFVETAEDSPYNEMVEWNNNAMKAFKPTVKAETINGVEALTLTYEINNETIEAYFESVIGNVPEHYIDVMSNLVNTLGLDLSFEKEMLEQGKELIIDRMNAMLNIDIDASASIACEGGALLNASVKGDVSPTAESAPAAGADAKIAVEFALSASADAIKVEMKEDMNMGEEMGAGSMSVALNMTKKTEDGKVAINADVDAALNMPSLEEEMKLDDVVALTVTFEADGDLKVEADINIPEMEKITASMEGSLIVKDGKATIAIDSVGAAGFAMTDLGISFVIDPTATVPAVPEDAKEVMSLTAEEWQALIENVMNSPLANLFGASKGEAEIAPY